MFYGLGLQFIYPIVGTKVGWMGHESLDTRTASDQIDYKAGACRTRWHEDDVLEETCQEITLTEEINIFEVDGFGLSEFLLPVRLIVGLVFLAFAYRLTPKG